MKATPRGSTPSYIIAALIYLSRRKQRGYCCPRQGSLLGILERYYRLRISCATLNRHLKGLESADYIRRIRRSRLLPSGARIQTSTLYIVTREGYKAFYPALRSFYAVGSRILPSKASPEAEPQRVLDLPESEPFRPIPPEVSEFFKKLPS